MDGCRPMSGHDDDPLLVKYQKIFERAGIDTIELYDQAWIKAADHKPEAKSYFDFLREELNHVRPHVRLASGEGARLRSAVSSAEYEEGKDGLSELDSSLGQRERNFCRLLLGAIIESYRITRLVRAKGRVGDLNFTLSAETISRACLTVGQLSEHEDYLITPRKWERFHSASSSVSEGLASSVLAMTRQMRRRAVLNFRSFLPRYAYDLIRRNWLRVFVAVVGFGWALAILSELAHVTAVTLVGFLIAVAGWLGPIIFERIFKRQWLNSHRKAIQAGTTNLYVSFLQFLPARAILNSLYDLTDDEKVRELFRPAPQNTAPSQQLTT
jgi:hypothetical protein